MEAVQQRLWVPERGYAAGQTGELPVFEAVGVVVKTGFDSKPTDVVKGALICQANTTALQGTRAPPSPQRPRRPGLCVPRQGMEITCRALSPLSLSVATLLFAAGGMRMPEWLPRVFTYLHTTLAIGGQAVRDLSNHAT